jgi:hypothetical protein
MMETPRDAGRSTGRSVYDQTVAFLND